MQRPISSKPQSPQLSTGASKKTKSRAGWTYLDLLVTLMSIGLLATLLPGCVNGVREASRRTQCRNNLKQIALACNNYENKFKIFPPASTIAGADLQIPGCVGAEQRLGGFSWRALILPDIEEQNLYNALDFEGTAEVLNCSGTLGPPGAAWTGAVQTEIDAFLCPSDPTMADIDAPWSGASYVAMISKIADYKLPDSALARFGKDDPNIGVLHSQKPARQRDLANDGTSHTIMLVEVDRQHMLIEQRGGTEQYRCGRWFNSQGCFADASRTPNDFGSSASPKQDEASFDVPAVWDYFVDKKTHGWGRAASSPHGDGAHVAMTDGSVHFTTKGVDLKLYQATCTRAGGETETLEF